MRNAVSGLCFVGFVLAGLALVRAQRASPDDLRARRRASALVLYALAVSLAAGLTQRDLWPFSSWSMMVAVRRPDVGEPSRPLRLVGVDADGAEHVVDARAWQPLAFEELVAWLNVKFPALAAPPRERVGRYLLERAEAARVRVRAGGAAGSFNRILGPFTAPTHILHPALWASPEDAPPKPFVRMRVYGERWNVEARRRDPALVTRALVYEYPAAP
jgi:hypothetical protein